MSSIKNASDTGKEECFVEPAGKLLGAMLGVMKEEGYIADFEFVEDNRGGQFHIRLNGEINRCGVITPRFSVKLAEMEYWETQYLPAKNFGILLLSTSKGVISHETARKDGVGGELLGFVY
jgi:small subunit ribosomal protein S8